MNTDMNISTYKYLRLYQISWVFLEIPSRHCRSTRVFAGENKIWSLVKLIWPHPIYFTVAYVELACTAIDLAAER